MTQFRGRRRQPLAPAVGPGILDGEILTFDEACFGESLAQPIDHELGPRRRRVSEKPDHRHRRLLRVRRERPRRRAAEQRYERAPPHSITSSARARSVAGTSRPSAFAVLRLITSWYLVGACTGSSAGFAPLRMRST